MQKENKDFMNLGLKALQKAEKVILKYYNQNIDVQWKADATPVTIADQKAEEVVREFLAKETPECGFIGEEFGTSDSELELKWILDPIDGTKSFIRSVPLFGSMLALWRGNEALVGIINLPAQQSAVYAAKGCGAFLDGNKTQVSKIDDLSKATILSGTINTVEDYGYGESFTHLRRQAELYRGWGDCYGYYMVISGRAEIMFDLIVSIWDIAPLPILLIEAGGSFTELNGKVELFDQQGAPRSRADTYSGLASNGILHPTALKLLNKT